MKSLIEFYKTMFTIRELEERLLELGSRGEVSDLHLNKGQEAISVGVCDALESTDYIVVHHRTIAHAIAKGIPLGPLVAEVLGRKTGICGGRAGEMHLSYPPARFMFSFQLVGTVIPVAAGLAWAAKHFQKTNDIVAVFHGDACTANGQWHEGLNIAAVQSLPLLLVCENNGLAGNIRSPYYLPTKTVAKRAAGYGINAMTIDGNKILEVQAAAWEAIQYVRKHSRPFLLEYETTRLGWHKLGQRDMRSKEELEELAKRDPLLWLENYLGLSQEQKEEAQRVAKTEVAQAIEAALAAPEPSFEDIA